MIGRKMSMQSDIRQCVSRALKPGMPLMLTAALAACANYAGIHSDAKMVEPQQYATQQSLPAQQGHWPAANWVDQFDRNTLTQEIIQAVYPASQILWNQRCEDL